MAREEKRDGGSVRVSVVVPAEAPTLLPAAAAELLKLLVDAHVGRSAEPQPNRPEAA
jgi:hypothetical protein